MARLLRDRYFAYDQVRGCDLATGEDVRLDDLPEDGSPEDESPLAPLIEVLDHGRDGDPRWVVAEARSAVQAAAMARRAAAHARRRGFVPVRVDLYGRLWDALADELRERTLLLIENAATGTGAAGAALVRAAARSPRPHVLLTFRSPASHASLASHVALSVREARAAYGGQPVRRPVDAVPVPPDVACHLERASRAAAFQRDGRHAAAERLLRDVAAALSRRQALAPAAQTLVALGRLLLERGRADAAETACHEAARLAEAAMDDALRCDARLWQVAARTDAGRLTDAESLCRAMLLAGTPSRDRRTWTNATLARVLLWQGRVDEAARLDLGDSAEASEIDETTAASIGATAARVLLAAGEIFEAGRQARAVLTRTGPCVDPLPRVVAHTAHLRVLATTGDLTLAEESLRHVMELARHARVPFRAARARIIWHDALRRAGRTREAQHELARLARMCRVSPPLLCRAIEQRLVSGKTDNAGVARANRSTPRRTSSVVTRLVHLAHEEESDAKALRRVIEQVAAELHTSRVDLLSSDAGPVSTLISVGTGLPTHLGSRVLEAGIAISAREEHGGREIGIPVRLGPRLVAAIVCRWPLDRDPLPETSDLLELAAAVAASRVDALLAEARETARTATAIPELVGTSAAMAEVRHAIERAAAAPFAVLIAGESGVGKELVARAIHQLSARRERRFCDVNGAALPDDLFESELFGHARGAFTGAVADRPGLFEEADGGTLFLDELPDLSPRGQAKLLRVLQQQEVRRVGETFSRKIDVRLVTATNREMRREVAEGRFRQDLLYRLDVIRIQIPPLRDRPEDVPVLAEHFWHSARARVGSSAVLTHGVLAELARYHWSGNIRELQNVIAALAVAAPSRGRVSSSLLPAAITGTTVVTSRRLADARAQFERRCVEVALARAGGSRTRAAAELGLSRQGLLKTMARLGIERWSGSHGGNEANDGTRGE